MAQLGQNAAKIWFIKKIKLFELLGSAELKAMGKISRMTQVPRRETIFIPGEPGAHVYLLKRGRVILSRPLGDGREMTLAILEPGEIFGEIEALEQCDHTTRAVALEDAAICIIARDDFEAMLTRSPHLSIRLTKLMGLRLHHIETRIEDLLYRDVPTRLAALLLDLADSMGTAEADGTRLGVRLTHREIANLIASTRETVSLTLGTFRDQGLITTGHRKVLIRNREGLRALSQNR